MVDSTNDIWTIIANDDDLQKGASYAEITLPWTFNRMMLNTGSRGQQERGLNIAKGIVAQSMLTRVLREKGFQIAEQDKSHRDDDLFDLIIPIGDELVEFDFKSVNYYSDYKIENRDPLSPALVIENGAYPGPQWARFFPMLVPHTQVNQNKQAYCFAIVDSIDPRRDPMEGRREHSLVAFPYGAHLPFFSFKRLCLAREAAQAGFRVRVAYYPNTFLATPQVELELIGEWAGQPKRVLVTLDAGEVSGEIGPFSCLSAFKITPESFATFEGKIEVDVTSNDYNVEVLNTSRRNINVVPREVFEIVPGDFCNLKLPTPYLMHIIGWIKKDEFLERYKNHRSWVWPNDKVDPTSNQPWTQITENDTHLLGRLGLDRNGRAADRSIPAGLMKTSGLGSGACCYVFPNVHRRGGVSETNLYVLPADLHPMEELVP